jgi:hypothetical protein
MIITFEDISTDVENLILNNPSIQIINRKSLQLWAETVPEIPSRKGSITKIMKGPNIGKICKINNIDYLTGKATVQIIPSNDDEEVVYIGYLKEINLFEYDFNGDEHQILSKNYFEFLNILRNYSNDIEFEKAIFNAEQNSDKFIVSKDKFVLEENDVFRGAFEKFNYQINIIGKTFQDKFKCSCEYFQKENKLCFHLIGILNEIGLRGDSFTDTWNSTENNLSKCMSKF